MLVRTLENCFSPNHSIVDSDADAESGTYFLLLFFKHVYATFMRACLVHSDFFSEQSCVCLVWKVLFWSYVTHAACCSNFSREHREPSCSPPAESLDSLSLRQSRRRRRIQENIYFKKKKQTTREQQLQNRRGENKIIPCAVFLHNH